MQLRINVIQFWASIVPMISMIKWQCHTCYYYHYSYYHFLLSLISWCAILTNTPGLRDSVVMQVLSDFYWTAATGAGLFTSNSATQQRHAEHCVQVARALCWERVSLTGIPTVYKQNARFGRGTHTSGGNAQFVRRATHASRVKYASCRTKWLATGGLKRN